MAEVWIAGDATCGREGSEGRTELRAAVRFGPGRVYRVIFVKVKCFLWVPLKQGLWVDFL